MSQNPAGINHDGNIILSSFDLKIGNSRFKDDEWDLSPLFNAPQRLPVCRRLLKFQRISSKQICNTIKLYAYHELGCVKPQTVKGKIRSLIVFAQYCNVNGVNSFFDVTADIIFNYTKWLKKTGFSQQSGYANCYVIEELIRIGQVKGWDVPGSNIFAGRRAYDFWNPYREIDKKRTKPIPQDIFEKILRFAMNSELDILTKAGIIIQSQTGLRINEVLSICEGCVKPLEDGHFCLEVTLGKTVKGDPVMHLILVNELVVNAVHELECQTAKIRKKSGLKELFVFRGRTIRVCDPTSWSNHRLRSFIRRWDIRDSNGDLYHLNSHQFRATFVADLVKKKVPIAYIMKHFSHVSIEMTAHYLTLKQEEIKELYSRMIFQLDSKIAGYRAHDIKSRLREQFKGKTVEEIDTIISSLCDTMSFNPLPMGVCLYDFRRGNCTNGDGCFFYNCPNFITEVQFYPVLKKELDLMEMEMDRFKKLGRDRDRQRQYVKYKCLKPLVERLEAMINDEEKAN